MPRVDVMADVEAIRAGRAIRKGNRFVVNHRTYVLEPGGRLFPRDGDGFYQLGRGAYRALALYNDPVPGVDVEVMLSGPSAKWLTIMRHDVAGVPGGLADAGVDG